MSIFILAVSLLHLLIVFVMQHRYKISNKKYNFLNLAINPTDHQLQLYEGLARIDSIASLYASKGMPGFYPHEVWDTLDSNMVPIVQYPFGNHYNPVTIAHTAMAFYDRYLKTGEVNSKIRFLNNINWLMRNQKNYYFRYEFKHRHASAPPMNRGWISAMAQGEGLGVLCVAFHATGDYKYLNCAKHIFRTLYNNTDSLWCFGIDNKGYYWLEEYPTEDFCHVLNGMLYALWGIWDYYVVTRDQFALTLFKAGIRTISDQYPTWKNRKLGWSFYCWHRPMYASYHQIHLTQLRTYADFFDIPEFRGAINFFTEVDSTIGLSPKDESIFSEVFLSPSNFKIFSVNPHRYFRLIK